MRGWEGEGGGRGWGWGWGWGWGGRTSGDKIMLEE